MSGVTIAEWISRMLGGDSQRTQTKHGRTLKEVCLDAGAVTHVVEGECTTLFLFGDGSLIRADLTGWYVEVLEPGEEIML